MRKFLALILLPSLLSSCDNFGSKKIKNLVELTPRLQVETSEKVDLGQVGFNADYSLLGKQKSYALTKHKIAAKPVFAKGTVYSLDQYGNVSAFKIKDKETIWSYNLNSNQKVDNYIGGGIAYNNDRLFVTNGSKHLIIIDAKTGHEILRKEFFDIIRAKPTMVSDDIVLVQTISNQVSAFSVSTSRIIWQHEGIAETIASSNHIAPLVYKNIVLINYSSGSLYALDAMTGKELWLVNFGDGQDIGIPSFERSVVLCDPVFEGDYVYLATGGNNVMKVSLASGQYIWQSKADDVISMSLIGNNLFITNNAKQLAALSTADGKVKWVADIDMQLEKKKSKPAIYMNPFVTLDNGITRLKVAASNGEIYSFDYSGGVLSPEFKFIKLKNISYIGSTCCGQFYIVSDKTITFLDKL